LKNTFKRILSITMAMVMVLTFSVTALAAPVDIDSADGDFSAPTPSSGPDYTKVTFVAGVGYELTAQKGTSTNKNGDVVVEISGSKVNEKRIPEVTAADEYYDVYGADYFLKNVDDFFANGYPHFGQDFAIELHSLLHSGQDIKAIIKTPFI